MKKLQIGLIVLVICFVVALSGCISTNDNNNNNDNSTNKSSNSNKTNVSASDEVNIVVNYSGSWAVDVSGPFGYRSITGTGNEKTSIGNVTGSVTASARKTEGGNEVLTVSITKGGKKLASQSTSAPWGGATAVFTDI